MSESAFPRNVPLKEHKIDCFSQQCGGVRISSLLCISDLPTCIFLYDTRCTNYPEEIGHSKGVRGQILLSITHLFINRTFKRNLRFKVLKNISSQAKGPELSPLNK